MAIQSSWRGYKKDKFSTLVKESDLLYKVSLADLGETLRTRLGKIDYWDLRKALESLPGDRDFNFDCHGNLFRITRIK